MLSAFGSWVNAERLFLTFILLVTVCLYVNVGPVEMTSPILKNEAFVRYILKQSSQ